MVFSLLRRLAGLEKPSQDNAEYINPTISIWPSLITSETTSVGITINSTLGTKCGVPNFAPFLLRALTDTDRVRGAIRIILFGDNAKFFEKMLPEHHCDRNIASVASTSDQEAANAAAEGLPGKVKQLAVESFVYSIWKLSKVYLPPMKNVNRIGCSNPQHYLLSQRNLVYTAMTRGRRLVVLVGQRKALAIAVRNDRAAERFSCLYDKLIRSQIDPGGRSYSN